MHGYIDTRTGVFHVFGSYAEARAHADTHGAMSAHVWPVEAHAGAVAIQRARRQPSPEPGTFAHFVALGQ